MHKIRQLIKATLLALLSMLLIASPVLAIADPSPITLNTVKVFQNIFVSGDRLFIGEHNINYTVEPTEAAVDAFQLQLRSTDNATLIRAKGATDYQWNLTSIYFTPAQVTSSNITWESNYIMRITGNPAMFGTLTEGTNMATKTLSPTDWNADGTLTSKHLLKLYIIDIAQRMEVDLAIVLLVTTAGGETVLNGTGRILILAAIPGLDSAIPSLFQLSGATANLPSVAVNATYETSTTISNKLGTDIANSFAGIGTFFGITSGQAAGIWIMLFILTVMSIVFLNSGNSTGAMILAVPIAVMGAYLGAIPLTLLYTIGFLLVAYMGYFVWLRGT